MNYLPKTLALILFGCCSFGGIATAQDNKALQGADVGPCVEVISSIVFDYGDVTLMALPDGSGPAFNNAIYFNGAFSQVVDGTISVQILDCYRNPWPAYPQEDIWLESGDSDLSFCPGENIADQDTDLNGESFWRLPLRAGGWSQSGVRVRISENHLIDRVLPLRINSPDIDGDLRVTLSDVALFASDFFGDYHFRSDVAYDTSVNLLDVTRMAAAWGSSCP